MREGPSGAPLVVAVAGLHDAGKTTVGAQMAAIWTGWGLRVGVIKHDGHATPDAPDDWEKPQSDTMRMAAAGAAFTMVTGGGRTLLRAVADPASGDPLALQRRLATYAAACGQPLDIILVEGFKFADLPKVVVLRPEDAAWYADAGLTNVLALVLRRSQGGGDGGHRSGTAPPRGQDAALHSEYHGPEKRPARAQVAALGARVYDEGDLIELCEFLAGQRRERLGWPTRR
ncbi:MAG: molybdopterin-guanine dinucleotide biosynthesis protein MobB [Alicyclobacillus sp.]|nr:molybdopterin-guanine dinucleotide biosynthesis protein MobB [Alicyclobacillus sp.]